MKKGRKVGKGLQSPGKKKQLGNQVSRFMVIGAKRRDLLIFGLYFLKSTHCFFPALFCTVEGLTLCIPRSYASCLSSGNRHWEALTED